MHGEDVIELFENKILRNYLCSCARNFSRNPELQEDLLQEAWLRICEKPAGRDIRYYIREGYNAMQLYYKKDLRHRKLTGNAIKCRMYRRREKLKKEWRSS